MAPSLEEPAALPTPTPAKVLPKSDPGDVKSSKSPLPEVLEFDAKTPCTAAQLVDALKVAGGVIVRNLLTLEEVGQVEADVRPWLDKDIPWNGEFFPPETRRAFGLVTKSETFAKRIVGHELWLEVVDALLTSELKHNWVGDKIEATSSKPQLNNTIVFSIGPGARDQALHRDDQIHHHYEPAVAEHHLGRDSAIGLFVAGKKTTRQNGATRFIPGSHLWDYAEGPPRDDQCVYAELNPGDAVMILAGAFHGGSANTTENEERLLFSCFFTRSWMRQEENQYLSNDWEKIKKLPPSLQERIGWEVSKPFLGWVGLRTPMSLLHPEKDHYGDLF